MSNVLVKSVEKSKARMLCSINLLFLFENRAVYVLMWKYTALPVKAQTIKWRMRFGCWKTKVTDTHSEYSIFIAFPLQYWLRESASLMRYSSTTCLVTATFYFSLTVIVSYCYRSASPVAIERLPLSTFSRM
jgi:hypothetical protein